MDETELTFLDDDSTIESEPSADVSPPEGDEPFRIDESDRYSRLRLIPWWRQERLNAARVLVVGAGALGNEVLKNLALIGVGTVIVIDLDDNQLEVAKAFGAAAVVNSGDGKAAEKVLPLTNQLYAAADADKAAALALIGLEFLKSGDQPLAERAAEAALQLYPKDTKAKDAKPLPLRAEVVALALLLEKKDRPAAGEDPDDKGNEQIGKIEALARQGKWEDARKLAGRIDEELVQFRARLAIAAAAVDAQLPETTDIEAALKMAENGLAKKAELSWPMFYLIQLASQTRLPQERVRAAADQISNTALRGRAQLAVFQAQLDQAPQTVDVAVADTIDAKSLARSLAALALARHNVRLNTGYASVVQTWPQPLRAFGALGIALGLQDREK